MVKGFGQQNTAYGILGHREIARQLGIINPLWRGLNCTVFTSQLQKSVKVFIIPLRNNGAACLRLLFL